MTENTRGPVVADASVSLDGYVAYEDDSIGDLFEWYENGDVEIVNKGELPPFHVTPQSAAYWNAWTGEMGALVVGRRLFDVTDGWKGQHPIGVPVVVLTHEPPRDWSYPGSERFSFVTSGIEEAIEVAHGIARGKTVAVAAGEVAAQALTAGLLDARNMELVPIVMGSGRLLPRDRSNKRPPRRPDDHHRGSPSDAPQLPDRALTATDRPKRIDGMVVFPLVAA
jgi:dihydrofolate reductase